MAGDNPKPATRGKGPNKPAVPVPPAAAASPTPAAAPKPPKPVASKPAPKAKPPVPMLPEPVAAQAAEPAPTLAAPVIPEVVVPPVTLPPVAAKPAPEPVAAAPEPAPQPVTAPEPPVSTPPPAPEPSSAAISHKEKTMEATIQDATAKTQTYFGDANERAKAAFEKSTKLFEDMNAFGKGNIEAVVESSKIAAKGFESFGQEAAEYTRKQFEGATAMMKSFASVKSPTELFKLQSDYFRQSFDSLVAESSKHTEALLKLAGEVAQPLSNRVALAAEKAKIAA
ncbi:phasin family protein [Sphingomonas sp. NFR15]|uniref:phasin family protein n=1 Tax=Sphingomonas sp. NFR15 TaxID=1566282 RepID=UPI00087F397A|nr:phasin family protein [Sphingomonas sp. NFR15]SDA36550.1 phasin family protein [Sphingomonas sp. NFR15]